MKKWIQWLQQFRKAKSYDVYTDGSLKKGKGAWAFVIVQDGKVLTERASSARHTTCNRMEFQAAIEALRELPPGSRATIFTDSRVLVKTMTHWIHEWKPLNWKKRTGRPIPSLDQILLLEELQQKHFLKWQWIKAHSGIVYNERCDELCIQAREKS